MEEEKPKANCDYLHNSWIMYTKWFSRTNKLQLQVQNMPDENYFHDHS